MARKSKDVFGFDEFEKAMLGMQKRYDDASTAFIAAGIRQGKKRAKQVTPKVKGELYKGWKEKKPKDFKGGKAGKVKVGLLYNDASHAHLYELGHRMITRDRTRNAVGKFQKEEFKLKKYSKASWIRKTATGAKVSGRVPGRHVRDKVMAEFETRINSEADRIIDKITREVEI